VTVIVAMTDQQYYVIMERAASEIMLYGAHLIPDLLQSQDYARALADADPGYTSDEQRDDAVVAKSERQATVLTSGGLVTVVLAEAALHQQVGGPDVMTDQLTHLAAMAADIANITVQVMPYSRGAHAVSGTGPFAIVRLGDVPGLGAVRVPDLSGGYFLTSPADVARHISAFTLLRAEALTPGKSRQLITDIAAGYSSYGIPGLKAAR
jgi:Domain of unknown function (DUF5753)